MTDLDTFRQETRTWLEENCPQSMRTPAAGFDDFFSGGRNPDLSDPDKKLWCDRMAERGWTVPTWPKEYGGGGLDKAEIDKVLRGCHAQLHHGDQAVAAGQRPGFIAVARQNGNGFGHR